MKSEPVPLTPEAERWAHLHGLRQVEVTEHGLHLAFFDRGEVVLPARQLFGDAPVRFDAASGQRLASPAQPAEPVALRGARAEGSGLVLVFEGGGELRFPMARLAAMARPAEPLDRIVPWAEGWGIRSFPAASYLEDADERRRALAAVAREGACLLRGLDRGAGALETIVAVFGFIRETNYGRLFDVRVEPRPGNLAFTDKGLAPHTDNPYREPPPTIQLLHCIETADAGGMTILADGLAAAERLRASDPASFALLASTPVRFVWRDSEHELETRACIIECDPLGRVTGLRVNDRSLAPLDLPPEARQPWERAHERLRALVDHPAYQARFVLAPGDVLIFDNRRILHGRTAFSGGARWLQGCYADRDGLLSTLAVLERREAEARAGAALAPLAGPGGEESYGEVVTLRAHCLQSAALAGAQGLEDEMIAAALLHDIGWILEAAGRDQEGHDQAGGDLIERLFGEAVADPVRRHVAAKRYLVAREDGYRARLSAASLATLAGQGGPMTAEEATRFERARGFGDAVALRRIDDDAKDANAPVLQLDAYQDLLTRLALAALRAQDASPQHGGVTP